MYSVIYFVAALLCFLASSTSPWTWRFQTQNALARRPLRRQTWTASPLSWHKPRLVLQQLLPTSSKSPWKASTRSWLIGSTLWRTKCKKLCRQWIPFQTKSQTSRPNMRTLLSASRWLQTQNAKLHRSTSRGLALRAAMFFPLAQLAMWPKTPSHGPRAGTHEPGGWYGAPCF